MALAQKIAWNTIIQFASKIISIVFGLFTIAIMTRYLGSEGFGAYTTINTFISFFAVAADLGLTLVTVQMISQVGVDQDKALSNLFSLRLFSALCLLALAPITAIFFPYSAAIKLGILITIFSYFFVALNQILVGLFQKELRLDRISIAEIVSRVFLLLGVFFVVRLDLGLFGILWVTIISSAISFLLHYFYSRPLAKIALNFEWQVWWDIVQRTWPIGLTIVFNLIYLRADTLILSIYKTQVDVGIYGAAYKIIDVLITLPFIFVGIVLPIMTSSWVKKEQERFALVTQRSFDLMAIIAVPMIFGAYFLADSIIVTVAGQEFAQSAGILRILIVASSIIYLGTVFSHAVIAVDKQKKIISAYVFVALTSLLGYLILIPIYSYYGAAWVTVYSETTIALASYWLVWRASGFVPKFNVLIKSFGASLVMSLVLWKFAILPLPITLLLGVFVYIGALFLFKGVTKEDLTDLMAKS